MIRVDLETGGRVVSSELLEAGVRAALAARGIQRAEISLTLLDDAAVAELNHEHLGREGPTDVLAFALWEPGDPLVVGDVYIGYDQALRQAREEGARPLEELTRLAVHGALHVAGMDHPERARERAASEMYQVQEGLVKNLMSGAPPRR